MIGFALDVLLRQLLIHRLVERLSGPPGITRHYDPIAALHLFQLRPDLRHIADMLELLVEPSNDWHWFPPNIRPTSLYVRQNLVS